MVRLYVPFQSDRVYYNSDPRKFAKIALNLCGAHANRKAKNVAANTSRTFAPGITLHTSKMGSFITLNGGTSHVIGRDNNTVKGTQKKMNATMPKDNKRYCFRRHLKSGVQMRYCSTPEMSHKLIMPTRLQACNFKTKLATLHLY